MFKLLGSKVERCPMVYVVANRGEYLKWRQSQPEFVRYQNLHNEACVMGLIHIHPPPKFVILPTADFGVMLRLYERGFIDKPPAPKQDPKRLKEIERWTRKLDKWAGGLVNQKTS